MTQPLRLNHGPSTYDIWTIQVYGLFFAAGFSRCSPFPSSPGPYLGGCFVLLFNSWLLLAGISSALRQRISDIASGSMHSSSSPLFTTYGTCSIGFSQARRGQLYFYSSPRVVQHLVTSLIRRAIRHALKCRLNSAYCPAGDNGSLRSVQCENNHI